MFCRSFFFAYQMAKVRKLFNLAKCRYRFVAIGSKPLSPYSMTA